MTKKKYIKDGINTSVNSSTRETYNLQKYRGNQNIKIWHKFGTGQDEEKQISRNRWACNRDAISFQHYLKDKNGNIS